MLPHRNITLSDEAQSQYAARVKHYKRSLLRQARLLADYQNAEIILSAHIDEADRIIRKPDSQKRPFQDFAAAIGGVLLGTFIQGFITELANGNTIAVIIYTLMGLVGLALILWGLFYRSA